MTMFAFAGLIVPAPSAKADGWSQKTVVTFHEQVEMPGRVLAAGTYVFKAADSQGDRHIVQVFNKNENHVYGAFPAIPDYKLKPREKTVITFGERVAGAPEAVKAWFYPGDSYGHEFVYPKTRAVELAKANRQPVPSMPNELAANSRKHVAALKQAPLKVQKPTEEEVEIAEVFVPPPAYSAAFCALPKRSPKTGSPLPLIGLFGLLSIGSVLGVRLSFNGTR